MHRKVAAGRGHGDACIGLGRVSNPHPVNLYEAIVRNNEGGGPLGSAGGKLRLLAGLAVRHR